MSDSERAEYNEWIRTARQKTDAGRWTEAEPLLVPILEREEATFGPNHPEVAGTLSALALAAAAQRSFGPMRRRFDRAMSIYDSYPGRFVSERVLLRSQYADLLLTIFEPGAATALLEDGLRIGEGAWGPHDPRLAELYRLLAKGRRNQHRYAEARAALEREIALRTEVEGPFADQTLDAMTQMARSYAYGEDDKAVAELSRRVFRLTIDHWDGRSASGAERITTLTYLIAPQPDGEKLLVEALGRFGEANPGTDNARFYLLGRLGELASGRRAYGEAEAYYRRQLAMVKAGPDLDSKHAIMANSQLVDALLRQSGKRSLALPFAEQARNDQRDYLLRVAVEDIDLFPLESGYLQSRSRDLLDSIWYSGPPRAEMPEPAFEAIQEATSDPPRHAMLRDMSRGDPATARLASLIAERDSLAQQWTRAWSALSSASIESDPDSRAATERFRAEIERVRKALDGVHSRLRDEGRAYSDYLRQTPLTTAEAKALMRPDEATLIVAPTYHGTYVAVITADSVRWNRYYKDWFNSGVEVIRLRRGLDCGRPACTFDRSAAYALYQDLIGGFERELAGKRHVFILADGRFGSLPFGTLVTEPPSGQDDDPAALRQTAWFTDSHALIQIPTLRSFALQRRDRHPRAAGERFAGFGAPLLGPTLPRGRSAADFASRSGDSASTGSAVSATPVGRRPSSATGRQLAPPELFWAFAPLPGAEAELSSLAATLRAGRGSVWAGARATETAVRTADLLHFSVIAFATHATLADELGMGEPGLIFTPPESPKDADDGVLLASEISSLRLNADWVILSGCNTGSGDNGGAALSGLARAFLLAGARSLLVSHWRLRDDVAPLITVRTLAIRRSNPAVSRAEALQRAIKEVREDPAHPEYAQPSIWGPFTLVGDATL
jgi:CHAT domain-containing protein